MRLPALIFALFVTVSSPLAAQLAVSNTSLPFGGVNQNYDARLTASGGSGEYSFAVQGLPSGLFFNTDINDIQGQPAAAGAFPVTIMVTDIQSSNTASKTLTIDVMQISTQPQLNASTCSFFSLTLAVSDAPPPPYSWAFNDSTPPPGLQLNASTGVLSGMPTTAGSFEFNIIATSGSIFATQEFFLTVTNLCFLTTSLPNGDVNSFYRQSLVISGGTPPFKWALQSGSLPTGVTLDAKSGLLSGTPTVVGPYTFAVTVTDSTGEAASHSFTVAINSALAFITKSPLPPGTAGTNYSETFTAMGGTPPYTFTTQDPPTNLTLSSSGVLSGNASPGMFTFTVTVTDHANISVSTEFQLSVVTPGPLVQVSPTALTFNAAFEGSAPPPQFVDVTPVGTLPVGFQVATDGGAGTPTPAWLSVTPVTANAPARLVVSVNQGTMAAQSSNARIIVTDSNGNQFIVMVTFNIAAEPATLQVTPDTLHFAARAATPGTLVATLAVRNTGGGGALSFSTAVQGNSNWITGINPASGQTVPNSTVLLRVQINTQGLGIGAYHDVIVFTSGTNTVNVPVALFVSGGGAILGLNVTGIRFQARQGGGYTTTQNVQVLDVGDPASSLAWTAQFVIGSQFFNAGPSSGNASPGNPGMITITPTASALQGNPGSYYALVKISSSQALNSPLYVVLVLDLASSTSLPLPDPSPAGLVFIGPAGKPITTGQTVNVNTSSSTTVSFQAAVLTADGGTWLTATPGSGTSNGQSPGQITVTVDATNLAPGIYSGELDISISGAVRSVNITLIVLPAAELAARALPATVNCTPAAVAITETGLVNNFAVPAGFPATLVVQLNDDCGNPVSNASVTASFSNSDPPLMLREGQPGSYNATWQPGVVSQQMVVTLQAQAAQLKPAIVKLTGTINGNPTAPPSLFENGTVNVFNRVPAGALAPGMIIEVYGAGLATVKGNPGVLPLPDTFQGTSLIVGPYQAPLYFVSSGQLDVQVASELVANQQYPVIASLNGALSVPVLADIAAFQLGVAAQADGTVIAQHGANSAYVTANSPAKPGEVVVIYLSGMGATNPAVKSGQPAPSSEPLARVTNQPTVTLDGQTASVQFAGLSPASVGLYQINFVVPKGARTGDLTLVISQNGVSSNTTRLPVSK